MQQYEETESARSSFKRVEESEQINLKIKMTIMSIYTCTKSDASLVDHFLQQSTKTIIFQNRIHVIFYIDFRSIPSSISTIQFFQNFKRPTETITSHVKRLLANKSLWMDLKFFIEIDAQTLGYHSDVAIGLGIELITYE